MNFCCKILAVASVVLIVNGVYAADGEAMRFSTTAAKPAIAIIIDDIGHRGEDSARAVALPGPVACAILPHTPFAYSMASQAHALGKEVILHLPLEATSNNDLLGPGAISLDDTASVFTHTLTENLAAIPHVVGINNHMGSLLTRHPGHMRWLMEAMRNDSDLFFVDSVTTDRSVAYQIAKEHGIPAIQRDVFLDGVRTVAAVKAQFAELKEAALENGYALAIGHPFPETLSVLEAELPILKMEGYRLVSVKEIIAMKAGRQRELKPSTDETPTYDASRPEIQAVRSAEPVAK